MIKIVAVSAVISVIFACSAFASAAEDAKALAEKGEAAAQFRYAEMLRTGNGIATNLTEAAVWTRKAAEQNHVEAQFRYGEMLRDGRGVAKSMRESVEWMRKAADAGHARAQCQMGLFYMNGLGVDRDEDKAVEWLEKAAKQNQAQAQYNLGIYHARFSDKESVRLALKWLNEAAKQDYSDAEYNLAKLYLNSHHPASKEQGAGRRAIQLLRLAAAQGHVGAKEMLKELGVDISTSQENLQELKQAERATFINNALL